MPEIASESVLLRIRWTNYSDTTIIGLSREKISKFNKKHNIIEDSVRKILSLSYDPKEPDITEITVQKLLGNESTEEVFDLAMEFVEQLKENVKVRKIEIKVDDYTLPYLKQKFPKDILVLELGSLFTLYPMN